MQPSIINSGLQINWCMSQKTITTKLCQKEDIFVDWNEMIGRGVGSCRLQLYEYTGYGP